MPGKRISMKKVHEILRLSMEEGWSQREISNSVHLGKTTVQRVLQKVGDSGLTWQQLKGMSEIQLIETVLYPPRRLPSQTKKPLPDWTQVRKQLLEKGVTLMLVWMDYKHDHPDGLQYSQFCSSYKAWLKSADLTLRHRHVAGDKLFVDFSGLKVPWLHLPSGEIQEASIFVAVLGASNMTFVQAVANESLPSWISAHVDAFAFFEGAPQAIVPDNLRSGVARACRYDPDTNPTYHSLAEHYGTTVMPTRARKPRDKAKVEVGVQIVQRWVLAQLRRQTFTSLQEINDAICPLLKHLNSKVMRRYGVSRQQLWQETEKAALRPLPSEPFEIPIWKTAKVNIDYHVEFERRYYSVPFSAVGTQVLIKATRQLVRIFQGDAVLASHPRLEGPLGQFQTLAEHMPPRHTAYLKWTPERILEWAESTGPSTKSYCQEVIAHRKHPEQGFRACLGILRLGQKFSAERLEEVCSQALGMKVYSYRVIERLLQERAKSQPRKRTRPQTELPHHENIRGSSYYN
jgi:transposase